MKSLNFQRNKSLIRVVNERKVKTIYNWDRVLYLGLLIGFILFMCYYLFTKLVYVHACGHVIIDNTTIRLTDDARIINFYKQEGDSIKTNDTLFSYALDRDDDANGNNSLVGGIAAQNKDEWWVKEVYALKKKITLNTIDISVNTDLMNGYKSELKRISNEVILDILPKSRLDAVQNELFKLDGEIKKLQKENNQLNSLIKTLGPTANYNTYKISLNGNGGANTLQNSNLLAFSEELLSEPKYFKSPVNGISTRIYFNNFETALKSEDVMEIHHNHSAFIKAYFELEDLQQFKIGDILTITFPDGTKSKGILKRFYNATYKLPDEFQKKYESTTRAIAADVYPLNSFEIKQWNMFHKMSVDISKSKFN